MLVYNLQENKYKIPIPLLCSILWFNRPTCEQSIRPISMMVALEFFNIFFCKIRLKFEFKFQSILIL